MSPSIFSYKLKISLLLGTACLLAGYFFLADTTEKQIDAHRDMPAKIVRFEGLQPDMIIGASIETGGKQFKISANEDGLFLTDQQRANFKLPYKLKISLQYPDETYRDVSWTIDSRGANYEIMADGFSPDDHITLRLNESIGLDKVPFDWSGRIELPIVLEIPSDFLACIDIRETKGMRTMTLCHFNPGKKGIS